MASRSIGMGSMGHGGRRGPQGESSQPAKTAPKFRDLWPLIREMILPRRKILALGFALMVINRLSGLVLPYSTKFLIDNVIGQRRMDMLTPLVAAVLGAT